MSTKQTAADEAFEKRYGYPITHISLSAQETWRTAWMARGVADIAAVEAALEGGVYPDEDWQGYKAACERIEGDIRALDEDVK